MFGLGIPEFLQLAVIVAVIALWGRLIETARYFGWIAPDRRRHPRDGAASPHAPYRTAQAPSPDPLIAEVTRLRRSLLGTRVVAAASGLALFCLGRAYPTPLGVAEPRPRPVRPRPPIVVPPSPAPAAGLPFDPAQNPTAGIGQSFAYPFGVNGYQVPMRFELPAEGPTGADAAVVSATLELDLRLRVIPSQMQGTEGIWVDGVLSGTTYPPYRVPALISHDLSEQNVVFTDAVTRCCREQRGHVSLSVASLLLGSGRSVESVLADRRLDVDIADDVEVHGARLVLCRNAPSRGRAPACVTVESRSLAGGE